MNVFPIYVYFVSLLLLTCVYRSSSYRTTSTTYCLCCEHATSMSVQPGLSGERGVGSCFYPIEFRLNAAVPLNGDQLFVSFPSKCDIITQALETSKLRLRHVIGGRPDILKNVSLRNELLCWTLSWRNCGARAAKVGGSYVLHLAAWLCSHTHTHTHRTSDVRASWHSRSRIRVMPMRVHFHRICARACTAVELTVVRF